MKSMCKMVHGQVSSLENSGLGVSFLLAMRFLTPVISGFRLTVLHSLREQPPRTVLARLLRATQADTCKINFITSCFISFVIKFN